MQGRVVYMVCLVVVVMLNSCYTRRENSLLLENNVPEYTKTNYEGYKIQVNDELLLNVLSLDEDVSAMFGSSVGTQQNSVVYRVYADSTIDMPYVGRVKVAGLPLREAQKRVKESLKSFGELEVRMAFSQKSFTVVGEAGRGVYPIDKDKITIFEALALAGNIQITGDHKNVHLIRSSADGPKVYTFDVRSKDIINSEYYYIQPNDIIYVDKKRSSFFKVQSYSNVLGVVSSVITFSLTVWNLVLSMTSNSGN